MTMSDSNKTKKSSIFLKNKMLGREKSSMRMGFKKKSKLTGDMKSSNISPSVEEFDEMMNSVKGKNSKKKSMFTKKNR